MKGNEKKREKKGLEERDLEGSAMPGTVLSTLQTVSHHVSWALQYTMDDFLIQIPYTCQ